MIFVQRGIIDKVAIVKQSGNGYSYVEDADLSYNIIKDNKENSGNLKLQYYFLTKPDNQLKYFIKVKLNKIKNFLIGAKISVPVYSSTASAIPTVSDEIYGVCNYLDKSQTDFNKFTCLSRFVNITRLCLYVISQDGTSGNVSLRVKFGNYTVNAVCSVTGTESWIYIENNSLSSGEISVTRNADQNDTLAANCIVTGIRVETK